jgi:predicted metalloendopeptidase
MTIETKVGQSEGREEDAHSTASVRVNVPLQMFESFHKAFSCTKKSPMNPAETCRVW